MSRSELGTFLQARRAAVQPAAGVAAHTSRRVAGLRREEVAQAAGVSVDYYARLEQGREKSPSPSVLNALAGVLACDEDARAHLFRLAGLAPDPAPPGDPDRVDTLLRDLLDAWPGTPAVIHNRRLDILAGNAVAADLYADFERADNLVRMTFLDPAGRRFFVDWARAAEGCVANLRLALGHREEEDVRTLVKEVHDGSAEFRRLWERHDVRGKTHEAKRFRPSAVGELTLDYLAFDVRSRPELQLVVYRAAPGSPDAAKLSGLREVRAEGQRPPGLEVGP